MTHLLMVECEAEGHLRAVLPAVWKVLIERLQRCMGLQVSPAASAHIPCLANGGLADGFAMVEAAIALGDLPHALQIAVEGFRFLGLVLCPAFHCLLQAGLQLGCSRNIGLQTGSASVPA